MTEQQIQAKIIKASEKRGAYVVKTIKCSKAGVPDILLCYNAMFVGIEVKKPGGKPSELQKYHIEKIRKADGVGGIVYSVEEAMALLDLIDEL